MKNAFLNGYFEEDVFINLTPRVEGRHGKNKVSRSRKSFLAPKQSLRAWFERYGKVVRSHGYNQSQKYHTVLYKYSNERKIAILIFYIDDIILPGDDNIELRRLKRYLLMILKSRT